MQDIVGYDCDGNEIEEYQVLRAPFSETIENWQEITDIDPRFYCPVKSNDNKYHLVSVYDDYNKEAIRRYENLKENNEIPTIIKKIEEAENYEVAYTAEYKDFWYYDRDRSELANKLNTILGYKKGENKTKIAVCCSSSDDIDKKYLESSEKLLEQVFKRENDLVFGAFNEGIMGMAYKAAKQNNRKVIGISPEMYKEDFENLDCDTEILTKNVNERTEAMINNSDILLFLPGGVGTIYELMSAIELKRSKEFDKPIIIYNETGFFDDILKTLNTVYEKNFTKSKVRDSYNVAYDYMRVMDLINRSSSIEKVEYIEK